MEFKTEYTGSFCVQDAGVLTELFRVSPDGKMTFLDGHEMEFSEFMSMMKIIEARLVSKQTKASQP